MPEIPVNEQCQLHSREYYIGIPRKLLDMLSEPIPTPVQFRPENAFRLRVLAPDPRHAVTALLHSEVIGHLREINCFTDPTNPSISDPKASAFRACLA